MIKRQLLVFITAALLTAAAAGPSYCLNRPLDALAVSSDSLPAKAPEPPEIRHVVLRPPDLDGRPAPVAASPEPSPGERLYKKADYAAAHDPINWSVMIYKSRHDLVVYFKGRLFKKYSAVFGRNLETGRKEYATDRRTPEGVYIIVEKYPSPRFHWFLRLNYPNVVDRRRYERLRADHEVPVVDGRVPSVGSSIGIHGTDVPALNKGLVNWTTGCISVSDPAIDQLNSLLPVGTLVIIKH